MNYLRLERWANALFSIFTGLIVGMYIGAVVYATVLGLIWLTRVVL